MKKLAGLMYACFILFSSCWMGGQRINGNGNIVTEQRKLNQVHEIYVAGNFQINLIQDPESGITVEADDNLLPYIITENQNGKLVIKTKENYRLSSSRQIKINVKINELTHLESAGNSTITGQGTFSSNDELKISLSGNGNIGLSIHNPAVNGSIAGSGNINIQGATKDLKLSIAGTGNWNGDQLMAENTKVEIAGTGDARVYASETLKVNIAGTGSVYYRGKAQLTSDIAGTGKVKALE